MQWLYNECVLVLLGLEMNLQWKTLKLFLSSADEMCASLSQLTYTAKKNLIKMDGKVAYMMIMLAHLSQINLGLLQGLEKLS